MIYHEVFICKDTGIKITDRYKGDFKFPLDLQGIAKATQLFERLLLAQLKIKVKHEQRRKKYDAL